jgi:hypothetical protein
LGTWALDRSRNYNKYIIEIVIRAFSILTEYSMVDFGLGPKEEVWGEEKS